MLNRQVILLLFCILGITAIAQDKISYRKEIDNWHQKRVESLLSPGGWINLEGLFWLKPGRNTFGSNVSNDIVYANPSFPKLAGYFEWEDAAL